MKWNCWARQVIQRTGSMLWAQFLALFLTVATKHPQVWIKTKNLIVGVFPYMHTLSVNTCIIPLATPMTYRRKVQKANL